MRRLEVSIDQARRPWPDLTEMDVVPLDRIGLNATPVPERSSVLLVATLVDGRKLLIHTSYQAFALAAEVFAASAGIEEL